MKKFYLAAPIDEIALRAEVLKNVPWVAERVPDRNELAQIQTNFGLDHATMALYQSVLLSPKYSRFIEAIRSQEILSSAGKVADLKIALLPAMFYAEHPEVGGGGEHIQTVAQNLGFSIERVPTKSTAGVVHNAKILKEWMGQQKTKNIWVLSMSKGSLEFRYAWTYLFTAEEKAKIKIWLNFGGFPKGNGLAETITNSRWKLWRSKLVARIIGLSIRSFLESAPSFEAWKTPLDLGQDVKVFSFFPIPLSSHVQTSLIGRYKGLSALGPNDGMTDCWRAIHWEGEVFPIWGADHFCRTTEIVPLLYRTFSYLRVAHVG